MLAVRILGLIHLRGCHVVGCDRALLSCYYRSRLRDHRSVFCDYWSDLGVCRSDLRVCRSDLGVCRSDLGVCRSDLRVVHTCVCTRCMYKMCGCIHMHHASTRCRCSLARVFVQCMYNVGVCVYV